MGIAPPPTLNPADLETLTHLLRQLDPDGIYVRHLINNPNTIRQNVEAARKRDLEQRTKDWYVKLETSLDERLQMVREWPDVLRMIGGASAFDAALKEAQDRIARFEHERESRPLLRLVVVPYGSTAESTIRYACARTPLFGPDFFSEQGKRYPDFTLRYRPGVRSFANCLRIEVIDFGAYWQPMKGFDSRAVFDPNFAHVGAIVAFAQYPRSMQVYEHSYSQAFEHRGKPITIPANNIPFVEIGGLELQVYGSAVPQPGEPGYQSGIHLDSIRRGGHTDKTHTRYLMLSCRHGQVYRSFRDLGPTNHKEPTMPVRLWE